MTIGTLYTGMEDANTFITFAKEAERLAVDSVWISEQPGYRDSFVVAAAISKSTERLKIFPGPVSPYSRHPMTIAASVATLQEVASGRVGLILGTGGVSNQEAYGVRIVEPVVTMRESIDTIRSLLEGKTLETKGQVFQFDKARLGVQTGALPIFLAAIGPKMQETAARYADGIVFSSGQSPKFLRRGVDRVRKAHASSERARQPFQCVGYIMCSMASDRKEAYDNAREPLSYMFSSPFKAEDWDLNDVQVDHQAILAARNRGDMDQVMGYITDELVSLFSASGTPAEFQDSLRTYLDSGIDLAVLKLLGTHDQRLQALRLAIEVTQSLSEG